MSTEINTLLLVVLLFYISNLQKNLILRVAGRLISILALYYLISHSASTFLLKNILQGFKTKQLTVEKVSEKVMPKSVTTGKSEIEKMFKEINKDIK